MQKVLKWILSICLAVVMCFGITAIGSDSTEIVLADTVDSYYSSVTASNGTALLGQIHDLITTTHTHYSSYSDCSNPSIITQTDAGSSSSYVMEFYSQADISRNWGSGKVGTWNREHVWCQSHSNGLWGESGGGGDLLHIRPSESALNSTRGNNKYGAVTNRDNYKVYYKNGSSQNVALGGYNSGGVFEPLDNVKGDVARIVMYVYTHYNTYSNVYGSTNGRGSSGYFGTLKFTDIVSASNENAAIEMLLQWHNSDPVSDVETTRNDVVYGIQGNRNPFVDKPDYANAIWGDGKVIPKPSELKSISLNKSALTLGEGKSERLTVIPYPADASAIVDWTSSNEGVATVSSSGIVTAKSEGTATITATSIMYPSIKATAQITVEKSNYGIATITLDSFNLTDHYTFKSWSAGGLSGIAYIYGGTSAYPQTNGMQFNHTQSSYYLASTTAAGGPIKSVTVQAYEGKSGGDWKLLTSASPYGEVAGKPTEGTDHGTKTVTQEGVTWTLSGEDTYFALTYETETAAGYLYSIVIEYDDGGSGQTGGDNTKLQQFHSAVENILTSGTLEARLASINNAIVAYQALSNEEKVSAASDVAVLQAAINEYNMLVGSYNDQASTANSAAYGG